SGARPEVPAKMTSSILPPRRLLAPCSPSTQAMASTTLDLPEPLGPTTQVIPGSSTSVVAEANDLKPLTVRLFRCTRCLSPPRHRVATRRGATTPALAKLCAPSPWGVGAPATAAASIRLRVRSGGHVKIGRAHV